jgi:SAM-dependent methyltransferase
MVLGCCPSCGGRARRPWLRHAELSLWLCDVCGLGYSDPQPRDVVERRYLSEYDLAAHFGALEARKGVLNAQRLDRLSDPTPGQTLLDVGCADGQFAAAARVRGWAPYGVELNPPAAKRARERGIAVVEGRLQDAELPAAPFDVVTAWDVIEHVPEPTRFVEQLVHLVAPGGLLVLTTLNRRSLVARVFRGRWSMVVVDHFTYWDAGSLSRAFAGTGMRTVWATSFGLGRDFVTWADRPRERREPPAGVEATASRSRVARASRWDARPVVVAAESILNRLLDATSLGVGVEIALRAPER